MKFKSYKVINLIERIADDTNIKVLIAEMAVVSNDGVFNTGVTDKFVFLLNSSLATSLLKLPQRMVEINLDDFECQRCRFNNGIMEVYLHSDFIDKRDNQYFNLSKELGLVIEKTLANHHLEMFFYFVFRYVIHKEFEMKNRENFESSEVFDKYKSIMSYILYQSTGITEDEYKSLNVHNRKIIGVNYAVIIEHIDMYNKTIANYVNSKNFDKKVLDQDFLNKPPLYPLFFQLCALRAYEIAKMRITNNLANKNFISAEFLTIYNQKIIKIYPTPLGFIHKNILVDLAEKKILDKFIDENLKVLGIFRCRDLELIKMLDTNFIFKHNFELFYFKRRPIDDNYISFGEQDREDQWRALLTQGQINLVKYTPNS